MLDLYPDLPFFGSYTALVTRSHLQARLMRPRLKSWWTGRLSKAHTGLFRLAQQVSLPTLSHEEHDRVVEMCVKTANGRVPVIAGAGSNSTAEAVCLSRHAEAVGADAVLIVSLIMQQAYPGWPEGAFFVCR